MAAGNGYRDLGLPKPVQNLPAAFVNSCRLCDDDLLWLLRSKVVQRSDRRSMKTEAILRLARFLYCFDRSLQEELEQSGE